MSELHDTIERKFVSSIDVDEWEIWTDSGWVDVTQFHQTIEYSRWVLKTETGKYIEAADNHIVFDEHFNQIFVKDCVAGSTRIMTEDGPEMVVECYDTGMHESMYDVTVDSPDHRFYSNGIMSHNTTTAVAVTLHYIQSSVKFVKP